MTKKSAQDYVCYTIEQEVDITYDHETGEDIETSEEYWLINTVIVPRELRGQGLARKAMEIAIAEMTEQRPDLQIKLSCEPIDSLTHSDWLADFYESLGFTATGNNSEMVL